MKSPKIKGIGEVVTEYGAKVMKVIKKGLLGRSLFDFYGDVKANALRVKESSSVPLTPNDKDGGVVYVKNADGKLYYKSNEVSEVELSAHTGLSTEEVQDIAGALVATGGTKTGIAVTYQDATGDVDFVIDHDAATNFVAAEHVDWAASGAGTIHTDNYVENVVQTTVTGSSGTVTSIGNLTGDVTSSNRATTIAADAVTYAKMQNVSATNVVLGRDSAGAGIVEEISAANLRTIINVEDGATADQTTVSGSSGSCTGNAATATALTSGDKTISGDLTVTGNDIKDSGGNSIISSNGSGVVTMAGGNILVDGTNANLTLNEGSDLILEADNAGGGLASSIQYNSSTGNKIMLGATSDVVVLCNRTLNGTVEIRANAAAGSGGEVTVATFEDDKVTISQDLDVAGTIRPGITYIKILPSDFIADDGGRPLAIDDTGSDRWLESHGTNPMFASVEIPAGFKATHVDIYGSATSAITVYEADVNSRTVTSKGTGNIGTQIDITDVTADATNYLLIEMAQASGEQVNGGKVTIAKA